MLHPPVNKVLLKIGDVFVKQFGAIAKTSMLYAHGSDVNPADTVNIVGEVVALPAMITEEKMGYKGFSVRDIQVGDTAIFRYDVIFQFTSDNQRFKNMFWYRGKEYWSADITKIFGVIRRGEIIMVNGYCMVESYSNPAHIILPQHLKNITEIGKATLTQIGNSLTHLPRIEAYPGDTVFYNPNILQKYEIGRKKFGILRQSDIMGATHAELQ